MTDRVDLRSRARPALLVAVALAVGAGLSGCATKTADQAGGTARASADGEAQGTGRNTGTFPNLNIAPSVAAQQLTPEQKQAKLAQLEAEKRGQASEGAAAGASADPAELKKLAQTHAQNALKSIEGD